MYLRFLCNWIWPIHTYDLVANRGYRRGELEGVRLSERTDFNRDNHTTDPRRSTQRPILRPNPKVDFGGTRQEPAGVISPKWKVRRMSTISQINVH